MNDPHVKSLYYNIIHADNIDYKDSTILRCEHEICYIYIENNIARLDMKHHFSSEESARQEVDPFLKAWELDAMLHRGPQEFEFRFDRSEVIDRDPRPGVSMYAATGRITVSVGDVKLHISRATYPEPPQNIAVDSDTEIMRTAYKQFLENKRTISDAANFLLTVIERRSGGRRNAAISYNLDFQIIDKIGNLCANKGGDEARKIQGSQSPYSSTEKDWLHKAMKLLIRRSAEVAYFGLPNRLPHLQMTDLPSLHDSAN